MCFTNSMTDRKSLILFKPIDFYVVRENINLMYEKLIDLYS